MSNGEVCCILSVCCPPLKRKKAAVQKLTEELGCSADVAGEVFDWFDARFDFAPKGTVQPLIDAVAEMARKHAKET